MKFHPELTEVYFSSHYNVLFTSWLYSITRKVHQWNTPRRTTSMPIHKPDVTMRRSQSRIISSTPTHWKRLKTRSTTSSWSTCTSSKPIVAIYATRSRQIDNRRKKSPSTALRRRPKVFCESLVTTDSAGSQFEHSNKSSIQRIFSHYVWHCCGLRIVWKVTNWNGACYDQFNNSIKPVYYRNDLKSEGSEEKFHEGDYQ